MERILVKNKFGFFDPEHIKFMVFIKLSRKKIVFAIYVS